MPAFRLSPQTGPRLLAGFGTAALLTGIGLASSRPVHSAGGPIAVNVANVPLSTTAADNPDRQGIQYTAFITLIAGSGSSKTSYTVPAGKRLVIESISASPNKYGDQDHYSVFCFTRGGLINDGGSSSFNVLPDGSPFSAGNVHPHQYADAGNPVSIAVYRTESIGSPLLIVIVTGYLVDMP